MKLAMSILLLLVPLGLFAFWMEIVAPIPTFGNLFIVTAGLSVTATLTTLYGCALLSAYRVSRED